MLKKNEKVDFGFKKVSQQEKKILVNNVFNKVSPKYDLMNDLASFGLHRYWKNELINWLAPQKHQRLADLAGGTGDITKRYLKYGGGKADIIDINLNMIKNSKFIISPDTSSKVGFIVGNCENLPIRDNVYDRITIAFGLRNLTNKNEALKEIFRILKPGGRFLCLEFSKVENHIFEKIYDIWSFNFLPLIGELVTNNKAAYQYLVESIRMFPNPEELSLMLSANGFSRIKYKKMTYGIVALHSAWKI